MRTRLDAITCLCALLLCLMRLPASAEPRTYTYGGSGEDFLVHLAVSGDGRIAMAGQSDSNDGTLADRAETGLSGWALCVDTQGNTLFSFLTRHGTNDYLRYPVFRADSSLTVVHDMDASKELELIRLDREGGVLARRVLEPVKADATGIGIDRTTKEDYLCYEVSGNRIIGYTLFDWDGNRLKSWDAEDAPDYIALGERHGIRGGGMLTAIDDALGETELARVMRWGDGGWDVYFDSLISLEDGGALAAGHSDTADSARRGCIARWDAQGDSVFSLWLPDEVPFALERTGDGFAAAVYPASTLNGPMSLVFFDDDGMRKGSIPLGDGLYGESTTMEDGSIALMMLFVSRPNTLDTDIRLVIVPKEDIP